MDRYPPIAEHGLIGDLQTAALVTTDGSVDWFCCPRFDSPSVFASLLDADGGGRFRIAAEGDDVVVRQLYFPDTAILITRFMTPEGVGEVLDFMPVEDPQRATRPAPAGPGGALCPRPDPLRAGVRAPVRLRPPSPRAGARPSTVRCSTPRRWQLTLHGGGPERCERHGDDVRGELTLRAGQAGGVMLESAADGPPRTMTPEELLGLFTADGAVLAGLAGPLDLSGSLAGDGRPLGHHPQADDLCPHRRPGRRPHRRVCPSRSGASATGIIATPGSGTAPSRSMPCWGWGSPRRPRRSGAGCRTGPQEQVGEASGPLKIMYRVDGSSDLDEEILDHWEGYAGSRPVRIGNGAADQLQLDIYGEALDSIWLADRHGLRAGHLGWVKLAQLADWLCDHWDQPDEGIWETRGGRQNFTYGRLMCWVALDRMVRLAREHGRPADLTRWIEQRDRIYPRSWTTAGTPSDGRSPSTTRPRCWTPRC